jgi:hypothetical protein
LESLFDSYRFGVGQSNGPIDTEATADQAPKKQAKNIKDFEAFGILDATRTTLTLKRIENGGRSILSRTSGKNEKRKSNRVQKKKMKAKDKFMFSKRDGDAKVDVVSNSRRQLTRLSLGNVSKTSRKTEP